MAEIEGRCRTCKRPFSPTHDIYAPGPPSRHPFILEVPVERVGERSADLAQLLTNQLSDEWDDAGGLRLTLGAEELGVVIDALIEHLASSAARKSGNPMSASDLRGEMCAALITRLSPENHDG